MDSEKIFDFILVLVLFPPVVTIALIVHELGHFMAARICNVRIDSFSIGFGRIVWLGTDKNGVDWILRAFPFIAHVEFPVKESLDSSKNYLKKGRLFLDSSVFSKIFIIAAGPFVSVMLPFLTFFIAILAVGVPVVPPVISAVEIDMPAWKAGIRPGDKIVKKDGEPVYAFWQIYEETRKLPPRTVSLDVERGSELLNFVVTPVKFVYVNNKGQKMKHGRLGVSVRHRPYKFKAIETISGVDVKKKPEKAREILLDNMGQEVILGLKSTDDKVHDNLVVLPEKWNGGLRDPEDKYYDRVFTSLLSDNIYLRLPFSELIDETVRQSLRLIKGIYSIPVQFFPINTENISPQALASKDSSVSFYLVFRILYMIATVSVFISMVNLIPFPGTDGSRLLLDIYCVITKRKELSSKRRAMVLFWALILIYLSFLALNIPDLSVYLDKRIEKTGEFFDDKLEAITNRTATE